jgi:putative membrane protein
VHGEDPHLPEGSMASNISTAQTTPRSSADIATELASHRTAMSFQRTRMSADRTLMAVVRTSLSLIGFGFTIFQVFKKLNEAQVLKNSASPRRFGEALVLLGIAMLIVGIGYHGAYMLGLRRELAQLKLTGLVPPENRFPVSLALLVAIVLAAIGIFAIVSMIFGVGPFG